MNFMFTTSQKYNESYTIVINLEKIVSVEYYTEARNDINTFSVDVLLTNQNIVTVTGEDAERLLAQLKSPTTFHPSFLAK